MTREQSIPLFLWVAAALVAHAIFGEGADKVQDALSETHDISTFARSVRQQASLSGKPLEVSMEDEVAIEPPPDEPPVEPELAEEKKPEEKKPEEKKPEPVAKPEAKKPEEKKPQEKPEEKKPELTVEKKPPPPTPPPTGRIAVQQNVKPDQKDNPNAQFMAEQANHTDEETRARVTSTDQNSEQPTPGGNHQSAEKDPGNSDEQRVAQSDESKGEKSLPPDVRQPNSVTKPEQASAAAKPTPPVAPPSQTARAAAAPPPGGQTAQAARTAQAERAAALEAMTGDSGRFSIPAGQTAQAAQAARKKLPEQRKPRPTDLLGFGSTAVTSRGVNLNLNPEMVVAVVGADRLAMERRRVGERRLAQHRGSWKSQGLEKWRPALENYVASVKPGNQTNLNTAHAPFARYLNEIHNRIHPVFADDFLSHLSRLPATDPINNPDMSTHLEVQLSGQDGHVMRLGITKSSGITAFDIGALDSVERAGPYGVPPAAILSSDGNVYLHWEFHRRPELACSTYFARPFILNLKPSGAPPSVEPPPAPTYDAPRDERTGSLGPSTDHAGTTQGGRAAQPSG